MSAFDRYLPGEIPPTLETLQKLWTASIRLAELAPWKYMWDGQVFVVEPAPGHIYYAQIMGRNGEVFRLHLYQGDAGFWMINDMQNNLMPPSPAEVFSRTLMLFVEFVPARELRKPDREAIALVGGKTRKAPGSPQWRAARKDCMPWYPTDAEAQLLHSVIDLCLPFLEHVRTQDPELLWGNDHYWPHVDSNGKLGRHHLPHDRFKDDPPIPVRVDERKIQEVRTRSYPKHGAFELDAFLSPNPVAPPNSRPFFAGTVLCCDATSGFVFAPEMIEGTSELPGAMVKVLFSAMASANRMPAEIRVRSEVHRWVLSSVAQALGIKIVVKSKLPAILEVRAAFEEMESGRRR